ncbi:hypothetical protein ABI59_15280 [Acidobacteria bacterium Mor1]|nr:hypothetical protein ABI59_15280 [Acidobacteria bacterium Mor1]
MGGNKGKRLYTRGEIREKVDQMIEECWTAVLEGAEGMEFTSQAKGRLRGFRGFRRPFYGLTQMNFMAYEPCRKWLLLQSRRLGRYARQRAICKGSSKITRSHALHAVEQLRGSACQTPTGASTSATGRGRVIFQGNWCDFAPIDP